MTAPFTPAPGRMAGIYRITPDGKSSIFFQSSDEYVMSLLTVGDKLYTGTADSGLIYEINPAGEAHCIYDSGEKAITALAVDRKGRLYAASAPKGLIYRIAPAGGVTTVWNKSKGAIFALLAAPTGELYAACGNVIYRMDTDDHVTILSDSDQAQFVALAMDPAGRLMAGSANVGTLYALQDSSTGTFESAVHDAGTVSHWGQNPLGRGRARRRESRVSPRAPATRPSPTLPGARGPRWRSRSPEYTSPAPPPASFNTA